MLKEELLITSTRFLISKSMSKCGKEKLPRVIAINALLTTLSIHDLTCVSPN